MTRDELLKLAAALSEAEERMYCFDNINTPDDPEKRIQHRAALKVVQSQLQKASEEYNAAIAGHTGEELSAIMKAEGK